MRWFHPTAFTIEGEAASPSTPSHATSGPGPHPLSKVDEHSRIWQGGIMLMVQGGQTPAISPAGQADNGESLVAVECKSSLHTSRRARSIAPWSRQSIALTQIQFSPGAPPPSPTSLLSPPSSLTLGNTLLIWVRSFAFTPHVFSVHFTPLKAKTNGFQMFQAPESPGGLVRIRLGASSSEWASW